MQAVVSRMTDTTISRFVSRHVIAGGTSTERLAQAFQTLVRDGEEQQRLLAMAHDDVAASPLGSTEGFESVWNSVAEQPRRASNAACTATAHRTALTALPKSAATLSPAVLKMRPRCDAISSSMIARHDFNRVSVPTSSRAINRL